MKDMFWAVLLGALVLLGGVVWLMLPKPAAMPSTPISGTVTENTDVTTMKITLAEFSFTVDGQNPNDPINFVAGQTYSITFVNAGSIEHEVLAGNGDLLQRDDGTPDGYTNNFFENQEITVRFPSDETEKVINDLEEIGLEPGESATVTLTIPQSYAGQTFEIGCFVPGHYEAGMKAAIVIQ